MMATTTAVKTTADSTSTITDGAKIKSKIALRPYQREMCGEVWREAVKLAKTTERSAPFRGACVQPTGAGKTVEILSVVNEVAKQLGWRSLVITPTRKLVKQTIERANEFFPELASGFVSEGKWQVRPEDKLIVATAAGISGKKLAQLQPDEFDLIVVDEAHHVMAESYAKLIRYFSRARMILGLTATFRRGNGDSILTEDFFPTLLIWHTVAQLTDGGYLAPARGVFLRTETDLNGVKKTSGGDYDERALAKAVDTPERNRAVVEGWLAHARDVAAGRQTVCFAASIAHAKHIALEFNHAGVLAAAVWGDQDRDEQEQIFTDYRAGKIKVITNAMLLIEGWDEPATACVVIARPATKASSFVLGPQMIGRGLRVFPGKSDALIIELRDKQEADAGETSLIAATMELDEKDIKPDQTLQFLKKQKEKEKAAEEVEYLAGQITNIEFTTELFNVIEQLEKICKMAWIPLGNRLYMNLSGGDFLEIVEETATRFVINAVENKKLKTLKIAQTKEKAIELAERWISQAKRDHALVRRDAEWRNKPASSPAIARAAKLTGRTKESLKQLKRGEVSDLIAAAQQLLSVGNQVSL